MKSNQCHGTGTPVGDPIETTAVGNVFGQHGVIISSVKPNVGHSEGCSGITSVIKAILILEKGIIPPQIKFEHPNPASMDTVFFTVVASNYSRCSTRLNAFIALLTSLLQLNSKRRSYEYPPNQCNFPQIVRSELV